MWQVLHLYILNFPNHEVPIWSPQSPTGRHKRSTFIRLPHRVFLLSLFSRQRLSLSIALKFVFSRGVCHSLTGFQVTYTHVQHVSRSVMPQTASLSRSEARNGTAFNLFSNNWKTNVKGIPWLRGRNRSATYALLPTYLSILDCPDLCELSSTIKQKHGITWDSSGVSDNRLNSSCKIPRSCYCIVYSYSAIHTPVMGFVPPSTSGFEPLYKPTPSSRIPVLTRQFFCKGMLHRICRFTVY